MLALSPAELAIVKADYRSMVQDDGTVVKLVWKTLVTPAAAPVLDPVYKIDARPQVMADQELTVRCVVKIVSPRDFQLLGFGILEVGDAVLYFLDTLNLQEPVAGKPVVSETLYFVDSQAAEWVPVTKEAGPLRRHLAMLLGNQPIATVVPCSLRR